MSDQDDQPILHRRKRPPSLRAVGDKAGVSHTAVAMALRDDPRLTEPVRRRVQTVAREEGYVISNTQGKGTIGVVVPYLRSAYVSMLTDAIIDTLWAERVVPLVLCSQLDVSQEEQVLQALASKRVSGVILMPAREDRDASHFVRLLKEHTPIVAVNNPLPQVLVPVVAADDQRGAELATRHLVEQGHRHILHLGAAMDNPNADRRREQGYAQVMQQAGLEPRLIHAPRRVLSMDEIVPMLDAFFASDAGRKTTAVFTFNDTAAYCVYASAQRQGRVVGKDLALVGYGNEGGRGPDVPTLQSVFHPSLSTVEQKPAAIGGQAVDILRQMIAEKPVPRQTLIEPELIVRESSSSPYVGS